VFAVRSPYTDHLSPIEAGRHALYRTEVSVTRALAVRASDEDGFVDVAYRALVADPIGTVKRIYRCIGWEPEQAAMSAMLQTLAEQPQHKHGRNIYTLEQFGLNRTDVADAMAEYIKRFPAETA
jgi:hypothetical protein